MTEMMVKRLQEEEVEDGDKGSFVGGGRGRGRGDLVYLANYGQGHRMRGGGGGEGWRRRNSRPTRGR